MKNRIMAAICCVIACMSSAPAQEPIKSPYFPLEVGHHWTYRATDLKAPQGKGDPKRNVVVEVERKEVYSVKTTKDGKEVRNEYMGYILKSASGGKSTFDHVVVLTTGVHRIHAAETPINPPLNFFKFTDLTPGSTWPCDSISANKAIKGTFTASLVDVTIPDVAIGQGLPKTVTFKNTYLISFSNKKQGNEAIEIDYWFAPNLGIVKQRMKSQNHEVLLELERFEVEVGKKK